MRFAFQDDTRGVSALVGAVLLLGILVIALSTYQAFIIPQQNAQTEFDHNKQVEDEMVDFRNALYEARLDDRNRSASVKLGTRYQSRTLTVNPPPATGSLQSEQNNMTVTEKRGDGDEVLNLTGNQFFEYNPSYSEYREAGTIRYENTLVYHEFDSNNVPLTGQRLVDGNTIRLIPSEPSIDENGIDEVTYEPTPNQPRVLILEDPEITLPTQLDQEDWERLLQGEDEWNATVTDGELNLTYDGPDQPRIIYSPVGDQENLPLDEDEDDDVGDPGAEVNPAGPGDVVLESVRGGGAEFTLVFRNTGDFSRTADRVRVPFYSRPGGSAPTVTINGSIEKQVGGSFVDAGFEFPPGEFVEITYEFEGGGGGPNPWFVTTFQFADNQRSTYFATGGDDGEPEPELSDLDIAGQGGEAIISEGDDEDVSVLVSNVGDGFGSFDVTLEIGDEVDETTSTTLIASGGEQVITFESVTGDLAPGDYEVTVEDNEGIDSLSGELTVSPVQEDLEFEIDGEAESVTIGNGATVDYTATAIFSDGSTQDVTDDVSVTSDDTSIVSVDEGANTVTGESPGEDVTVTADDGEFQDTVGVTVDVDEPEPEPANFNVTIDGTNESVEEGETLVVTATIDNTGGQTGTQDIELSVSLEDGGGQASDPDGVVDVREEVELQAGEDEQIELEWETDDDQTGSGANDADYNITVSSDDDDDSRSVTVQGVSPGGGRGN